MILCWLHIEKDIGTAIREHKEYIQIPKFTALNLIY